MVLLSLVRGLLEAETRSRVEVMTQEKKKKLVKKAKQVVDDLLSVADAFDVANAKDKDFDITADMWRYTAKKGQAGTRTRGVG